MKECVKCKIKKEFKCFAKTRNECRTCSNARRKSYYDLDPRTCILQNIKQRCKKLKIPFDISIDDIIIPDVCPILEIPLKRGSATDYVTSPTVDRLKPELGYVKGNVKVISMMANRMKSNASHQEIKMFCKNIFNYLK